jgi:hypothetical protein
MDGLKFSKKVYDIFEQIRKSSDGINKLRLREGSEKKLIEELIPIARFIQARYNEARHLKVRWINGTQQFDALIQSTGALVENGFVPRNQYIEVTTAVHENGHILRRMIVEQRPVFSVKGIKKNKNGKDYSSIPYAYSSQELENDLTSKLIEIIEKKTSNSYPEKTILVIQCILDSLFEEEEWEYAIQQIKTKRINHRFQEIFIFDSNHTYSATIL